MYILGIKPSFGWQHRFVNMWGNHDPAAALLCDGEIVAVAEEERFSRQKQAEHTFPRRSIEFVFDKANIGITDIDVVAIGRSPKHRTRYLKARPSELVPTSLLDTVKFFEEVKTALGSYAGAHITTVSHALNKMFDEPFDVNYESISHHRCHAASAKYCADLSNPITITVDNQGEHDSTVLWDRDLTRRKTFSLHNSIGRFYASGTRYLGYDHGSDAGKVMGLASYGEHRDAYADAFESLSSTSETSYDVTAITAADDPVSTLEEHFGPRKTEPVNFDQRHQDFAYHLQLRTEEIIKNLVRGHIRETGVDRLTMAGGIAMNCKMNREVLNLDCVNRLFIQPAANDSGICLGAALEAYRRKTGSDPNPSYEHVYFGPEYSSERIHKLLVNSKLNFEHVDDIAACAADLLADGKLVGWFQGRMEYGARALGNRSILANPTSVEFRDRVNENIKHRETWRPFAPSLLHEAKEEYLVHGDSAPHMILLDEVPENKRQEIPAVTHVDGTTRPQTVSEDANPLYYQLISEFANRTGVPVVLNTSFNVSGEPIVESPAQAIQDFYSTGLDALAIGDYILEK